MSSKWTILDTGRANAVENMAIDAKLLESMKNQTAAQPTLHFYEWTAKSVTYGLFIEPSALLNMDQVKKESLQLAQRPTGGGVIFHLSDFAFSLLIPQTHHAYSINPLNNYAFVNELVIEVIKRFSGKAAAPYLLSNEAQIPKSSPLSHFCMAKPTKFDVMLHGRKVGGGAQRRTRFGILHQGTISLSFPPESLLRNLLRDPQVLNAMLEHTFPLLSGMPSTNEIEEARQQIRDHFTKVIKS
jgi:lipoate---protein ligase